MRDDGKVRVRSDKVEIILPIESVAYALLDRENKPYTLVEAWANGDGAAITVTRVPWQTTDWRLTTNGWRRGPYRIWNADNHKLGVECTMLISPMYEYVGSLDAAKARCRQHCEDDLHLSWTA